MRYPVSAVGDVHHLVSSPVGAFALPIIQLEAAMYLERCRSCAAVFVRATTIALASVCLGTAACRSAPRPPEICLGNEVLAVRNDTGESVDIYETRGGISRIIGTAGAGRTEFAVPPAPERGGYRGRRTRDGQWITRAFGGRYGSSRIRLQIECVGPRVR